MAASQHAGNTQQAKCGQEEDSWDERCHLHTRIYSVLSSKVRSGCWRETGARVLRGGSTMVEIEGSGVEILVALALEYFGGSKERAVLLLDKFGGRLTRGDMKCLKRRCGLVHAATEEKLFKRAMSASRILPSKPCLSRSKRASVWFCSRWLVDERMLSLVTMG